MLSMRLITIVLLTLSLPLNSQEVLTIPDSLFETDRHQPLSLKPFAKYTKLTEPIRSLKNLPETAKLEAIPKGLRYEANTDYWFRGVITSKRKDLVYLNLGALIEGANVFVKGYEITKEYKTGGRVWPQDKAIFGDFIFSFVPLDFRNSDTLTVDLLVRNGVNGNARINLSLLPDSFYQQELAKLKSRNTFFAAIFMGMIFYHLFIFLISKESIYLTYVLWAFFTGLYITSPYFLPQWLPAWQSTQLALVVLNTSGFIYILFNIQFLNLRGTFKLGYQTLRLIAMALIVLALPNLIQLLFDYNVPGLWQTPSLLTVALMGLVIFLIGMKVSWQGDVLSRYFFLVNAIFLITMIIAIVIFFLGTGYTNQYENRQLAFLISGVGSTSQIILFGLIMGYRIFHLQQERAHVLQEKVALQQGVNLELEQKVSERTSQLEHRNKENELLLGEIHHRVKNNLQVISSLLKLQSRQLEEGKAKSAVLEGRDRVKSMALIHQRLYQQDKFSSIEMHDYIQKLVDGLAESYGYHETDYQLRMDVPLLHLDVDTAIPLGLIINELVSNVFKHAFKKSTPNLLSLSLSEHSDMLKLSIEDNGDGISGELEAIKANSFGLQLLEALANELDGTVDYKNGKGSRVDVSIKYYKAVEVH